MPVEFFALGDFVQKYLSWLGITSKRIERLMRIKDCGCDGRQASLNQWGYKVQYHAYMFSGGFTKMTWAGRLKVVARRLRKK